MTGKLIYKENHGNEINTLKTARRIRSVLGANSDLKEFVINTLLSVRRSDFGSISQLASHLTHILAWTDMHELHSIYEALVIPRVRTEYHNLRETMKEIVKSPYPEFYRYREGKQILEMKRFPTLIAVAQRIIKQSAANTRRHSCFVTTTVGASNELIEDLIQLQAGYRASAPLLLAEIWLTRAYIDDEFDI